MFQQEKPASSGSLPELSELDFFFAGALGLAGGVLTGAALAGSRRRALAKGLSYLVLGLGDMQNVA